MAAKKQAVYVIQSNWGAGWEDVHASTLKAEALTDLAAYRTSEPHTPHRMIRRMEHAR